MPCMAFNDLSTTQLIKIKLAQYGQNQMLYSKHLLKIFHRAEITILVRCLATALNYLTTANLAKKKPDSILSK